jgi:hypothetical protein
MRWFGRAWAAVIVAGSLADNACGTGAAARFAGHWKGVRVEGVTAGAEGAANAYAADLDLIVHDDWLSVASRKGRQMGRFKILKQYATSLTIATDRDGTDAPQTFLFPDDKTMKWLVLEGQAIVFAKR